jgi:hypothetical protein
MLSKEKDQVQEFLRTVKEELDVKSKELQKIAAA